jgi:hypothetical protein
VIRRFSVYYFGGAAGALVNSLLVWLVGAADVTRMIGVAIAPRLTWAWLSHRILWGSLWGLGYFAVARRGLTPVRAGLLLSLAPSTAQLFYFFPTGGAGWLGTELGGLTPLFVLAANAVWGWVLGRVIIAAGES